MKKKIICMLLTIFLVNSIIGCSNENNDNLDEKIGIRGEITDIKNTRTSNIPNIILLVEGSIEKDTMYDKASITVSEKVKVIRKSNNKELDISSLKVSDKVEVFFAGPVAESYPVQAEAKKILLLQ